MASTKSRVIYIAQDKTGWAYLTRYEGDSYKGFSGIVDGVEERSYVPLLYAIHQALTDISGNIFIKTDSSYVISFFKKVDTNDIPEPTKSRITGSTLLKTIMMEKCQQLMVDRKVQFVKLELKDRKNDKYFSEARDRDYRARIDGCNQ